MFTRIMNLLPTLGFVIILLMAPYAHAGDPFFPTGWYAGAYGGYISGELNSNDPSHKESTGDYNDDSPMAGIFAGYDWNYNKDWIAGVELMIPLYIEKGTAVDKQYYPDLVTYEASYRYALLLAAKWGHSFGNALPYVFGAIGFVNVDGKTYNVDNNDNYSPGFVQSATATHFVWQLGAGIDYQISKVWFLAARVAAFIAAQADHTMSWNEPGPNLFGYDSILMQINVGYRF